MCISALLVLLLSPAAADVGRVLALSLAPVDVAYEGEVAVTTYSRGGKSRETWVRVAHLPPGMQRREVVDARGFVKLLVVSDGEQEWTWDRARRAAWRGLPADPDEKLIDPDEEIAVLRRNYRLRLEAPERVAGRLCDVLVVARQDGAPVRRLWVERAHGLVLQRRTYHPDGGEAARMVFTSLRAPAALDADDFVFTPPHGTALKERRLRPDYLELEEAAEAAGMRPRTPAWLPPGYAFESVNLLPHRGMVLLHMRYSDGLAVLSLFQAPAGVRLRLAGTSYDAVGGADVGAAAGEMAVGSGGRLLSWQAGARFALMGDLPWESLRRVAESIE